MSYRGTMKESSGTLTRGGRPGRERGRGRRKLNGISIAVVAYWSVDEDEDRSGME